MVNNWKPGIRLMITFASANARPKFIAQSGANQS